MCSSRKRQRSCKNVLVATNRRKKLQKAFVFKTIEPIEHETFGFIFYLNSSQPCCKHLWHKKLQS